MNGNKNKDTTNDVIANKLLISNRMDETGFSLSLFSLEFTSRCSRQLPLWSSNCLTAVAVVLATGVIVYDDDRANPHDDERFVNVDDNDD